LLPKIGPVRVRRCWSIRVTEHILKAKAQEISQVDGFGLDLSETIAIGRRPWISAGATPHQEESLTLLTQEDDLYPKLLREIHDPPLVLYVRGN